MFNYDGQKDLIRQCKSFIRWAFSRGNSCADPEGDREHERVKRGIGVRTPPSKMTSYMGLYRN